MALPLSYKELVAICNRHAKAYYVNDSPEISDEAYDQLYASIVAYELEHPNEILSHSPTQRIGYPVLSSDLGSQARDIPMMSLDNAFTEEDMKAFMGTLFMPDSLAVELKFDGVGLELIYVHGVLVTALTRGDGKKGEIVTHNAKTIRNIPLYIEQLSEVALMEIRGEVVMPYKSVEQYKEENPDRQVVSPRNIAAGALRQLDPKIAASRKLQFFPHSLGKYPKELIPSYSVFNRLCKQWGFSIVTTQVFKSLGEVSALYNKFVERRNSLPFAADGMVIKINELDRHDVYGVTAKAPRWAIAWKFPSEEKNVVLKEVIADVGRTGVISPVAIFDPVELSGVMVTNATLHNYEDIQRKDIRLGDTIVVTRSGDVIPKVLRVDTDYRTDKCLLIAPPKECPSCGCSVVKTNAAIICPNSKCRGQAIQRIVHFASRKALNIVGLADATAEFLYDTLGLRDLHSVVSYNFDLYGKATTKTKTYQNLQAAIDEALDKATSAQVLFGLGLPRIGEVQAEEIVKFLKSRELTVKDLFHDISLWDSLISVRGIGDNIISAVKKYLSNDEILYDLKMTLNACKCNDGEDSSEYSTIFDGKTFVITGALSLSREDVAAFIKNNGGRVTGSVSKKTSYLVVGESPGMEKTSKADSLGIPKINEKELYGMISTKTTEE